MEKKFKALPPIMPNFVRFEQPPGKRQDGFNPSPGLHIKHFTREEALEYAEVMKEAFIRHWESTQVEPSTHIGK